VETKQLLGEYECKIDAKGRMRMPSGLIAQLGEGQAHTFVINRGFEKCLMLYPEDVWGRISAEVNQLNLYNKKNRDFVRYFYRGAQKMVMDSADRILVSKRLLEYAAIQNDVVLSAYNDRIEMWASEEYEQLLGEEPADFSDLADEVLGRVNGNPGV
jgi:MraZ protein